jgi:hypothetical protein
LSYHFTMLLFEPLVKLLRLVTFLGRPASKILVARAALVNHESCLIDNRVEKWMGRATILGLDVIQGATHAHIRIESEVHRTSSFRTPLQMRRTATATATETL